MSPSRSTSCICGSSPAPPGRTRTLAGGSRTPGAIRRHHRAAGAGRLEPELPPAASRVGQVEGGASRRFQRRRRRSRIGATPLFRRATGGPFRRSAPAIHPRCARDRSDGGLSTVHRGIAARNHHWTGPADGRRTIRSACRLSSSFASARYLFHPVHGCAGVGAQRLKSARSRLASYALLSPLRPAV